MMKRAPVGHGCSGAHRATRGVVRAACVVVVAGLVLVACWLAASRAVAQTGTAEPTEIAELEVPGDEALLGRERSREQLAARASSLDLDPTTLLALRPGVADSLWWALSQIDARRSRGHVLGVISAVVGLAGLVLVGTAIGVSDACSAPCNHHVDIAFGIVGSVAGLASFGLLGGAIVVHTEADQALSLWRDRVVLAAGRP